MAKRKVNDLRTHDRANSVPIHKRYVAFKRVTAMAGESRCHWTVEAYGPTRADAEREVVRVAHEFIG